MWLGQAEPFRPMFFRQFSVQGLGHASYLLGSEQTGEALVFTAV